MTATGRGTKISTKYDVYPTPQWAVTGFLEAWPIASENRQMHWLESSAGDGAIVKAVNAFRESRGLIPIMWTVCEIRDIVEPKLLKLTHDVRIGDFVNSPFETLRRGNPRRLMVMRGAKTPEPKYDAGIFNPPFQLTMEFLRLNKQLCEQSAMLQRQNFIGSADRNEELRADLPDQYMIPDRVDFAGDGQGDAIGHSWWTWDAAFQVQVSELHLLPCTPLEIRKAQRPRISLKRPIPTTKLRTRKRKPKPIMLVPTTKLKTRKRKHATA